MPQPFDAARDHRFAERRWFDDFVVGERFWIPLRTPTDALFPRLEIVEPAPQRTTGVVLMRATVHNQCNELVLEGSHRYLLRRRPPGILQA
jgi:hypothetical protein